MIKSFANKETEELYITGKSRKFSHSICNIGERKLDYPNASARIDDLKAPPGNRLEPLKGDRNGFYSIRVNDQYRVVFRFEDGDAYDVEITDYH
ncbi:MAG: type II toxin-antitoxin system RelE/ParE family toxin [Nitrospirae bacterium]|nr:type II toxin-antitoxin system RelE/ParE family toxin [Nitrospirota bacterium]